jgi:hypothetical protein
MTEYGLFNDEGCWESGYSTREGAEARRDEWLATEENVYPDDVVIKELCPDHEGEAKDECGKCFTEYDGDE